MSWRRYTEDGLRAAVAASTSFAGVLRCLGLKPAGGTHRHIRNMVIKFNIDHRHFTGSAHNKGKKQPKKTPDQILVNGYIDRPRCYLLRRALIAIGRRYECAGCGCSDWMGKPLTLEVHHLNGDWLDNRAENLQFKCPNCHSQD
jgi:hypothetical protein